MNRPKLSFRLALVYFLFGLICVWMGGYIVALALNFIQVPDSRFHAPRLVAAVAGLLFILPGLWMIFHATLGRLSQASPFGRWTHYFYLLVLMLIFSGVFLWSGFGQDNTTTGRSLTGGFGILALVVTLWYAIAKLPGRRKIS